MLPSDGSTIKIKNKGKINLSREKDEMTITFGPTGIWKGVVVCVGATAGLRSVYREGKKSDRCVGGIQ